MLLKKKYFETLHLFFFFLCLLLSRFWNDFRGWNRKRVRDKSISSCWWCFNFNANISSFPSVVSIPVTRTILMFSQEDLCMKRSSIFYIAQSKNLQILRGPILTLFFQPQDKPRNFVMQCKAEMLIIVRKKGDNWLVEHSVDLSNRIKQIQV